MAILVAASSSLLLPSAQRGFLVFCALRHNALHSSRCKQQQGNTFCEYLFDRRFRMMNSVKVSFVMRYGYDLQQFDCFLTNTRHWTLELLCCLCLYRRGWGWDMKIPQLLMYSIERRMILQGTSWNDWRWWHAWINLSLLTTIEFVYVWVWYRFRESLALKKLYETWFTTFVEIAVGTIGGSFLRNHPGSSLSSNGFFVLPIVNAIHALVASLNSYSSVFGATFVGIDTLWTLGQVAFETPTS